MQIFTATSAEIISGCLSEEESKHCVKVLRKTEGDQIFITDGTGSLITAEIVLSHPKKCQFKIISHENTPNLAAPIYIAIAPTKMNDRFEFFLEKATEIGVQSVIPITTFHSERKVIKEDRLEKIIIAACKQSKNFHFPTLAPLTSFKNLISDSSFQTKLIAHCEDEIKTELSTLKIIGPTLILIGPEGDFSSEEIKLALKNNFQPVSLGKSRLRTETAGIVAATLMNANYEG